MPYHLKDNMSLTIGIIAALLLSAVASASIIDLGCRRTLYALVVRLVEANTAAAVDSILRDLQTFIDNNCVFPWNSRNARILKASARRKRRRILGLE